MLEFHRNYKSIFPACSAAASYYALALANSVILWTSSGADHARLPLQSVGAQACRIPAQALPSKRAQLCPGKADFWVSMDTPCSFNTSRIALAFHCKALQMLQTWNRGWYRVQNCNSVLHQINYFMSTEARKTINLLLLWSFKSTGLLTWLLKCWALNTLLSSTHPEDSFVDSEPSFSAPCAGRSQGDSRTCSAVLRLPALPAPQLRGLLLGTIRWLPWCPEGNSWATTWKTHEKPP